MLMISDVIDMLPRDSSELVAGKTGIHQAVTDIIVMEAHDIEKWLRPGQLVLSSLYSMNDFKYDDYINFIQVMKTKGASGLIIKVGRFVEEIPVGIIDGCNKFNLSLIAIESNVAYSDVILSVMQSLINIKAEMLDLYQNIHHEFKHIAMSDLKLIDVLNSLKRIINRDVALMDSKGELIATTTEYEQTLQKIDQREVFQEVYMHFKYTRELVSSNDTMFSRVICEIPRMDETPINLYIYETNTFIQMMDYMAIENAASSLQYEFVKQMALKKAKDSHMNDLVDHIINGKYSSFEELKETAMALNLPLESTYSVITWELYAEKSIRKQSSFEEYQKSFNKSKLIAQDVKNRYGVCVYRIFSNRITFIIEANYEDNYRLVETVKKNFEEVYNYYNENDLMFHVGISDMGDLRQISKLAIQPLRVVQLSEMLKLEKFVIHYNDLGVYRMLLELSKHNDLMEFVSSKVKTVSEYNPEYLETLKVFLEYNQNYKKTSEALYVHPKTVRYRIERMSELFSIDFDNSDDIMQIRLSIFILYLTKNNLSIK